MSAARRGVRRVGFSCRVRSVAAGLRRVAGTILVEAEKELGARVERAGELIEKSSRKFRDDEVRRVEVLLESGRVAINLAREANQTALVTADRAEQEFNKSVGRIAEEMSRALLAESGGREEGGTWRLAGCVAAAAVAVFIRGREGGVRRCWRRSTAVGLSRGWCGRRMEKLSKCAGSRI